MLKRIQKLSALILALALFAVCIPTGLASQPAAPKVLRSYYLYQYGSGGKDCVAVASNQVNTKGAAVYRARLTKGAKNQQVVLTRSGDYYYIHWLGYSGAHSGRDFVLDQSNNVVTQYTRIDGKDNQLWKLVADSKSGAYRLQNKKSGLYLTYQQSSNSYVAAAYKGNSTQLFQFYTGNAAVPEFLKTTVSSSGSSSKQADRVVDVALKQKGKTRGNFGWRSDWCAYFVCWAGRTAGADFPKSDLPWPPSVVNWFVTNNKGTFYCFRDKNYADLAQPLEHQEYKLAKEALEKIVRKPQSAIKPQKGDLVCFRWNDAGNHNWSHIGIVTDVRNGFIYTVEGNCGGRVATRQYVYPNNAQIVGLIRPNYK